MRYLLHKHIPVVTALDTVLGERWGYAIFVKAPLVVAYGHRVTRVRYKPPQSVNWHLHCTTWTLPTLKMHWDWE